MSRLLDEDQNVDMDAEEFSLENNSWNTTRSMEVKVSLFTQEKLKDVR